MIRCQQCHEAQEREHLAYIEELLRKPPEWLTPEQLATLERFRNSVLGKS